MPHIRPQSVVDDALRMSDAGIGDRENARIHGVAVKTIRRWRRLYQRRGLPRGGKQGIGGQPCPRCEGAELDRPAYSELLGWYLGDGTLVRYRSGTYLLRVVNDARYVDDIWSIRALMTAVKPGTKTRLRAVPGAVVVSAYWKHWPCLFPQHGTGRKHERPIVLEDWQRAIVDEHPEPLLRGLFKSDGCRVVNWTVRPLASGPRRYEYLRYFFCNESDDIIGICSDALARIGVHWTRPRRNMVSVARRADVARLDEFIGPKS
jgi:hypothetical protein